MGAKQRTPPPDTEPWDEKKNGKRPTSPPPPPAKSTAKEVAHMLHEFFMRNGNYEALK